MHIIIIIIIESTFNLMQIIGMFITLVSSVYITISSFKFNMMYSFRCKNNRFPATLIQDLEPVKTSYGWRIPYLSYGTGSTVTAFVPVGSYDPDDYTYSQLVNVNNSTGLQYFIEGQSMS